MDNRNKNSFYKSDREKFKKDMKPAYGCRYVRCFFPLLFVFIVSLIALVIWQTKFWLFTTLVLLVLILRF